MKQCKSGKFSQKTYGDMNIDKSSQYTKCTFLVPTEWYNDS